MIIPGCSQKLVGGGETFPQTGTAGDLDVDLAYSRVVSSPRDGGDDEPMSLLPYFEVVTVWKPDRKNEAGGEEAKKGSQVLGTGTFVPE